MHLYVAANLHNPPHYRTTSRFKKKADLIYGESTISVIECIRQHTFFNMASRSLPAKIRTMVSNTEIMLQFLSNAIIKKSNKELPSQ